MAKLSDDNRYQAGQLIEAMLPLDVESAQDMALRLPMDDSAGTTFYAQRAIARFLLATEEERQSAPLGSWSAHHEDDGRFRSGW